MAISDSSNPLQASTLFELATGLETSAMHLQTLLDGICQAVEDENEALTLTLVESARHFVADVDATRKAMYATLKLIARCQVAGTSAANAASDEAVA